MPVPLRAPQRKLEYDVYAAWNSSPEPSNVIPCAPTGFGKTVFLSKLVYDAQAPSIVAAHRQELVSQLSMALAKNGVRHAIIAPPKVIKVIRSLHIAERSIGTGAFIDANSRCRVGGILSLNNCSDAELRPDRAGLAVIDEGHHVLAANVWGQMMQRLRGWYGLFPTATPSRADGMGLGRHADGLADHLVLAPTLRETIDMGFLTDYRYIGVPVSDIQMTDDDISDATGDFNQHKLRAKHHASTQIVGDVVEAYMQYARGKVGVTFAVDVEEAVKMATEYKRRGVPAEVLHAKTDDTLRAHTVAKLRRREILQIVNVDLLGEGFDLPAIEVVSFARHTASFGLYTQQWGRALRLLLPEELHKVWDTLSDAERRAAIASSTKPRGIIIDHVDNMGRHMGPPDALWRAGKWTLDRREKRTGPARKLQPIRLCANRDVMGTGVPCGQHYEKFLLKCPYCGHYPAPPSRSAPEYVDGDLFELDDEALMRLRGQIIENLETPPGVPYGASAEIIGAAHKRHWEKQQAHAALRNAVAWWSGLQHAQGRGDRESYRRFYLSFAVDVGTMQTLPAAEARELYVRVATELGKSGINAGLDAGLHLLNH